MGGARSTLQLLPLSPEPLALETGCTPQLLPMWLWPFWCEPHDAALAGRGPRRHPAQTFQCRRSCARGGQAGLVGGLEPAEPLRKTSSH